MSEARHWRRLMWVNGRADRREYGLVAAAVYGTNYAVARWGPRLALDGHGHLNGLSLALMGFGVVTGLLLVLTEARRFHDLGLSGWWTLVLNLPTAIVTTTPAMLLLTGIPPTGYLAGPGPAILKWTQLGLVVALGLRAGRGEENRFGPPSGGRKLAEVFG